MLKSDSKGFLVGEPVDIKRTLDIWQSVRDDIRDIKSRLFGDGKGINVTAKVKIPPQSGATNRTTTRQKDVSAAMPLPRRSERTRRDSGGRKYDSAPSNTSLFDEMVQSKPAATPTARKRSFAPKRDDTTATPERDEKGRFVSNRKRNLESGGLGFSGSHDRIADSDVTDRDSRFISSAAEKIASAVTDASSGLEDTDPTVKAFGEIAQPIARGYQIFSTGSGKEQKRTDRWFRRIFGEIKLFRKEETGFSKIANQRLKGIEEKPAGSSGNGLLSFILGAGVIAAITGAVAKRIPGMAALLTGAKSIFDLYSGFSDDDLETGDRNKKIVRGFTGTTGILAGAYAGGKTGAAVGSLMGPAGTAIGGVLGALGGIFLGDMAGRNAGEVFAELIGDKFDIKDELVGAWDRSLSTMKDQFNGLMNKFGSVFDSISNKISSTWDSLTESIKEKFGIDVKEKLSNAKNAIKESALGKSVSNLMDKLGYAADKAQEFTNKAGSKLTGSASRNEDALIRQMDRAGITDPKERAMFMAQMSHESAGFTRMDESFNYRSADRIMEVSKTAKSKGRTAIEQAMAQGPEAVAEIMYGGRMGNVNPGDAYKFRGRGHIQLTGRNNYEAAGKALGIDLVKHPELASKPEMAAKIAAWYWQKNNLGDMARAGNTKGVRRGINGGLNGLSDVDTKYASYMASLQTPSITRTQTVSAQTPAAPKIPAIQHKIPDAPSISEQLTSGSGKRNQQPIVINSNEVGQDVKDRRIAHVVTGGLSD